MMDTDKFTAAMDEINALNERANLLLENLLNEIDPQWREHAIERKTKPKKVEVVEMSKSNMVDADVMEVLKSAWCEGNKVYLPPAQMERKLYVRTNEVLTRIGGKWKGGKTRAHVFEDDPAALLAEVLATGIMPLDNPLDFYETPPEVVKRMIDVAGDLNMKSVLEPSAGNGAIVWQVIQSFPMANINAIEFDQKRAGKLREKYSERIDVYESDFMQYTAENFHDVILMNPPFTLQGNNLAYIDHIKHAIHLLKEGGKLVAIAPASLKFRSDKRTTELREHITKHGTIEDLPVGSFGESGTLVSTVLVSMVK